MTLDQLRALHAVVEFGGFRPAAEALFKSQSAVSIAIRKLEDELGITLFSRDQYRPTLTGEGKALHEKAMTILSHAEELITTAHHFAQGEEPELRVAMSAVVPVEAALGLFSEIKASAPATRLVLLVETLNGTLERLEDGDADIAITETFDHRDHLTYAPLTGIEMVSVISPKHRLADRSETLTEKDMAGSTQIIVRDTSRHSEKRTAGIVEGTRHWVVSDFTTKKQIIASGIGWGRMPMHMVEQELGNGELLLLGHEGFHPLKLDIKAVRKKEKPLGPVATELWQQLQNIDWNQTNRIPKASVIG
ncbi:MAG: LysR family transcriptional regulator [Mariprofundaceae bacterium]|nr:LysR family transcriptional regulator [Mariprofundaceae bacterium]